MTKTHALLKSLYNSLDRPKEIQCELLEHGKQLTKEQRQLIVDVWNALDIAAKAAHEAERIENSKAKETAK